MEASLRAPLLQRQITQHQRQINPEYSIHVAPPEAPRDRQPPTVLFCLDVFTGLCILGMILCRNLSDRFPLLGHSPWNGLFLGDLIVPFLLFSIGAQISYSLQNSGPKSMDSSRIISRSLQLFALGLFLDGGFFHASGDLAFGVSLTDLRLLGFLQRLAVSLLIVGLCHVAVSERENREEEGECCSLCSVLIYHWQAATLVVVLYLSLTFLLYVPDWDVPLPMELAPAGSFSHSHVTPHLPRGALSADEDPGINPWGAPNVSALTVVCGTSGDLSPGCNSAGYIDRAVLGIDHLFRLPSYRNLPDCEQAFTAQIQSPGNATFPPWCVAPFEPAGILSTLGGTLCAFLGLHLGHVLRRCESHASRMSHLAPLGVLLCAGGWVLQYPFSFSLSDVLDSAPDWAQLCSPGLPFNMNIFSTSFALFTSGLACHVLCGVYLLVDWGQVQFYTRLFEWSGKNWLILYSAVVSPVLGTVVAGFYWRDPENNLGSVVRWMLGAAFHDPDVALVIGTFLKVIMCGLFAGLLCWQDMSFSI